MTTEQELNEKLLKFAGIIWSNEYQYWLYRDGGYSDAPIIITTQTWDNQYGNGVSDW